MYRAIMGLLPYMDVEGTDQPTLTAYVIRPMCLRILLTQTYAIFGYVQDFNKPKLLSLSQRGRVN